jgi:3-methyl-2-oxobutanoate hydroxymethyltransferase
VTNDLLGFGDTTPPRFVRRYADLRATITEAVKSYASDIAAGRFPSEKEAYPSPPQLDEELAARR